MAKEKKTPKEASNLFHNMMGASVKGNPKPAPKKKATNPLKNTDVIEHRDGGDPSTK